MSLDKPRPRHTVDGPGPDLLDLGAAGAIHSLGDGDLADGPDVLVFRDAWSPAGWTASSRFVMGAPAPRSAAVIWRVAALTRRSG